MNNYLSPLIIIIALTLAGLLYAIKAHAAPLHVYEDEISSIRLMPEPCVDGVSAGIVAQVAGPLASRARAIDSDWKHRDGTLHKYPGCWLEFTKEETGVEATFLLAFSDGKYAFVTRQAFLKVKGGVGV